MDLEVRRGDTPSYDLTLALNGSAYDLTNCQVYFTAKAAKTDADPGVFQLTIGDGISLVNAEQGQARIRLSREHTATVRKLVWDVQITKDDDTYTPLDGTLKIVQDVTATP